MRLPVLALMVVVLSACPGPEKAVPCDDNADCDLSTGGVCSASAGAGRMWCSYPDPECPSGLRFSDENVGDDLAGTCTDHVAAAEYTLTVSLGGDGEGAVIAMPDGLTCSSGTCTGTYQEGTVVELSATAVSGAFLGWALECRGKGECAVTMDYDRTVGALFGTPGTALWAKQLGTSGDDQGNGIAVDTAGSVIAVGEFRGAMPSVPMPSAGSADGYVMKLDSATGGIAWAKRFGGLSTDIATDVAVDSSNNVYVVGIVSGAINFAGTPVPGAGVHDLFLMKLTPAGDVAWTRRIPGSVEPRAISLRGSNLVMVGSFSGMLPVDAATLTSAGGPDVLAISVSTADGATIWAKGFGGPAIDRADGVAIDSAGNVVMTGSFGGTVNFGGAPLSTAGETDVFVLKVAAANGSHLFSRSFGAVSFDYGSAVAVDAANNLFVTGQFGGAVDFGCGSSVTAMGTSDIYLAKYSQAGACAWAKSFPGSGIRMGRGVTVNADGDVAITGQFCGTISFGGPTLISASPCNTPDVFAARLAGADAVHLNSVRAGGTGTELATDIAQTPDGRIFVTGWFSDFAEFGGDAFTSAGGRDAFLLGLAPL